MALWIVQDRPRPALITAAFDDAAQANSFESPRKVGNLEEDYSLVCRRIVFCAATLDADEAAGGGKLRVVACLCIGEFEPEDLPVEALSSVEVGEVEFDTSEAERWRFFAASVCLAHSGPRHAGLYIPR